MAGNKKLYILLSQTGTVPSRVLKIITHAKYNHVSLSLSSDLTKMYSFGRRYLYFPIPGGFVAESRERGVFKRYPHADIAVLELEIGEETYQKIAKKVEEMYAEKGAYRYNLIGLGLAAFKIVYRKDRRYYCSEFVRDILVECGVAKAEQFERIVQPMHFIDMSQTKLVYQGQLSGYST